MRYKRRYLLIAISGIDSPEEFEKRIHFTLNKLDPFLGIDANVRIIKELTLKSKNDVIGVISVNNKYLNHAIFILSMMGRFFKSNLLTLISSGSLKRLKAEEKTWNNL